MRRQRLVVGRHLAVVLVIFVVNGLAARALSSNPSEILRSFILGPGTSLVFNMLVFFVIFLGISVRPLKDKLGRPGVAVAVGFALLFSASLAVTGRLNLLDLEPIAGVALFTLLGVIVGVAFRRLYETSWATTAAVSFVAGYGTMRLAAPGLLPVADELFIIPGLLYVLAIVWLIYSFSTQAFPTGNPGGAWLTHAQHTLVARPQEARQRLQEAAQDQEVFADVAGQEVQEHVAILAELDETERAIRSNATTRPELRDVVTARLQALSEAQRKVEQEYARYSALSQRITGLDAVEYADLKKDFEQLPDDIQGEARAELSSLNEKLKTDSVLTNLGQAVESNNLAVREALSRAKAELAAGRVKSCLKALNEARTAEGEALRLTSQIKRFAGQLKSAAAKVVAQAGTRAAELVTAK